MRSESIRVMIVEDERDVREPLAEYLRGEGFEVTTAADGAKALSAFGRRAVDIVLSDVQMPNMGGMELLSALKTEHPTVDFVIFTAFGTVETAVDAIRAGACDYILKPIVFEDIKQKLERIHSSRTKSPPATDSSAYLSLEAIVGASDSVIRLKETIRRVAQAGSYVLIHGESGSGKELVARALHLCSTRSMNAFVAVNCAAVPEHLMEAEFFGYARGAFTGAVTDKKGLFESAHRGTLFLDEILELPLVMQAKLLRVVEERTVTPIGMTESVALDLVVIAASARELRGEVDAGRFREDLYYRLNVVDIQVPPLRQRKEDIPVLARHFLAETRQRINTSVAGCSPEAQAALLSYRWPGNIRELRNVVERAAVLSSGEQIQMADLPDSIRGAVGSSESGGDYRSSIRGFEKDFIIKTLQGCGNDKKLAAKVLGIGLSSLYRKLDEFGID
ncbi:MAG: sigma-54-dependent transcriptional regulator [Candidatus Zixiibacteriota bacterium]